MLVFIFLCSLRGKNRVNDKGASPSTSMREKRKVVFITVGGRVRRAREMRWLVRLIKQ
jgi:hypothetical protein